jgi:ACS family sodium-dependent inorganic phosphate cotransporter-like MFS transporter 5
MTFLGTFVLYALRINLSVAIVAMTNATSDKSKEVTNASCNPTAPVFQWDNTQQALILSAFFYAYPLFQLPGGYISTRLSAKYMIGVGIFVASILSLLTPLAVTMTTSIAPLVTVRVLQGLAESACMPSFHSLVAKWAPPLERSRMTFISGSGVLVGCSATLPLAGWLCNCGFAGGWPSVFYVSGIAGVLWFVLWLFLVYDTPGRHPRISLKELKYIQNALADQQSENIRSAPWISILTSWPVWAIIVAHTSYSFGFYILVTCLPTFLKDTQNIDIKADGLLSSIPYMCDVLSGFVFSFGTDFILTRGAPRTFVRKCNSFASFFIPAVFLVICSYFGNTILTSMIFLCIAFAGGGGIGPGHSSATVDIAPKYTGIVMGIANTTGAITGIAAPFVVKSIASATPPDIDLLREQWRQVFIIAAEVNMFGAIIFLVMGSAKLQSWARTDAVNKTKTVQEQ